MSVNSGRYVPFTIMTTADSIVMLIMAISPAFVKRYWRFQNARDGTIARTISVSAVYAQSQ